MTKDKPSRDEANQDKRREKSSRLIFKKISSVFIRIIVSIALLFFLFRHVDEKSLLGIIRNTDKGFLLLAFFIFFWSYALCLSRWRMLLGAVGIRIPFKRVIISFAGGTFFNLFLPSTIGGDLMRSMDLANYTKRPREVVATVLLDRLSGYVGLVLVALSAMLFGSRYVYNMSVLVAITVITALLVVILLVLFNNFIYSKVNKLLHSPRKPSGADAYSADDTNLTGLDRIREYLKELHREIHVFRHHKKVILHNLMLSILIQVASPLAFYAISLSLGVKINIVYFFVFLPIIGAITLLPISIGGLGLRDTTTVFFFAQAGLDKNFAFAMSLLSFFIILIYAVIGGVVYVLTVHHRRV